MPDNTIPDTAEPVIMTTAGTLTRYREEHRWAASAGVSAIVVVAMLAGGYFVADAINQDTAAGAPLTATVTEQLAARSVGRVLEARLQKDRLKILMGIVDAPTQPAAEGLDGVLRKEGFSASGVGAADYLVAVVESRAAALSSRLAGQLSAGDVQTRLLAASPTLGAAPAAERRTQMEVIILPKSAHPTWVALVREWADTIEADASVKAAWSRLPDTAAVQPAVPPATTVGNAGSGTRGKAVPPARRGATGRGGEPADTEQAPKLQASAAPQPPGPVAAFLERALDVTTLPTAVAAQIATDVTIATIPPGELDIAGKDLAARLAWGAAAVLFLGLWVAAMSICCWQIFTLLPRPGRVMVPTLIVAGIVGVVAWTADRIAPGNLELLGPLLTQLNGETGARVIETSRALTGLAAAAVVVMLVASAAVTWVNSAELLESQLEGLRMMFNAGAALLVAGAIEIATLYGWVAGAFETAAGSGGALSNAAVLAAGFTGALFSAALVIVYLPAVSTLRRRAAAGSPVLEAQGFGDSGFQQFARLLQALAPLLVTLPVSALVTLLQ